MKITEFPEQVVIIGKDQPEYLPLPAWRLKNDPYGRIVCCWRLSFWERIKLLWTGIVWHEVLTCNKPLQPQKLSIEKPEMPSPQHE